MQVSKDMLQLAYTILCTVLPDYIPSIVHCMPCMCWVLHRNIAFRLLLQCMNQHMWKCYEWLQFVTLEPLLFAGMEALLKFALNMATQITSDVDQMRFWLVVQVTCVVFILSGQNWKQRYSTEFWNNSPKFYSGMLLPHCSYYQYYCQPDPVKICSSQFWWHGSIQKLHLEIL